MTEARTVGEVLDAAADLLTPEGAWTQGALARDEHGAPFEDRSDVLGPRAQCFCAWGAITRAYGDYPHNSGPSNAFCSVVGTRDIGSWNDAPGRTKAEVVAALRTAASLSRHTDGVGR